jgi:hypothetical protein
MIKRANRSKADLRKRQLELISCHAFRCYDEIQQTIASEGRGHWLPIIAGHMDALLTDQAKADKNKT